MLAARAWGEEKCCGVHPPGNSPQPIEGGAGESGPQLPVAGTGPGRCTPRPPMLGGRSPQCLTEVPLGLNITCPQGYLLVNTPATPSLSLPHSSARVFWGYFPQTLSHWNPTFGIWIQLCLKAVLISDLP